MSALDVEQRWPELFDGLTAKQREAVLQPLANAWHEGWQPNRDDVALLVASARGEIDTTTAIRLGVEAAARRTGGAAG